MGLYSGGLIIGGIFASEIWGAYFREGLFFFLGGGNLLSEWMDDQNYESLRSEI